LILINNNDHEVYRNLTVWEIGTTRSGMMRTVFRSDRNGYTLTGEEYKLNGGLLDIAIPPESATILAFYKPL
jgi:alpha-glucosidase